AEFFFASRRRHTRFSRDWSSDVCSSDLAGDEPGMLKSLHQANDPVQFRRENGALLQPLLTPFAAGGPRKKGAARHCLPRVCSLLLPPVFLPSVTVSFP